MAQIKISALTTGTPQGTDLTPATDTTDTTQAASGTTKKFIRSAELNFYLHAQGLTTYTAALVATTAALTAVYANGVLGVGATLTNSGAQAALTVDGVLQVVGNRVLVKNQAAPAQNGIYTVTTVGTGATNWVLTRATDFDQAAEVIQYGVVLVNQGTVSAGLLYQETGAGPFTMGTTAIVFAAYTAQSLALPVSLAQGGTSAALVADNGGVFFSNATTGQILASTSTANQMLMSGASQVGGWSTATWPVSTTINEILYSSAANTVSAITAAVGGVLISSNLSVPSFLANPTATGRFLQSVSGAASIWSTAAFPTSIGAAGTILRSDGTNWAATTSTFADTYSINTILYAGSANTVSGLAATARGVLVSSNTSVPSMLASASVTGQILQGSTTAAPSWSTPTYPSASGSAGVLLRSDGTNNIYTTSTFADTYAVSTILYASGSNAVTGLAAANRAVLTSGATGIPVMTALASDGQVIVGSTAGAPAAATLTPGTGISIANGSNSITISATGGGFGVATVAGTTQSAAVNTMYILLNAGQTTVTLPGTCSVGDSVILVGSTANTGGWILDAPAGDTIMYNGTATSAGGTITSSALAGQTIEVVCDVQDASWVVVDTVNTTLTTA